MIYLCWADIVKTPKWRTARIARTIQGIQGILAWISRTAGSDPATVERQLLSKMLCDDAPLTVQKFGHNPELPVLHCLSLTLSLQTTPFGGFSDYFGFSHFLAISCSFQRKRPLDSALSVLLLSLSVLLCCCAANQYSQIGSIFKNLLENCAF